MLEVEERQGQVRPGWSCHKLPNKDKRSKREIYRSAPTGQKRAQRSWGSVIQGQEREN